MPAKCVPSAKIIHAYYSSYCYIQQFAKPISKFAFDAYISQHQERTIMPHDNGVRLRLFVYKYLAIFFSALSRVRFIPPVIILLPI